MSSPECRRQDALPAGGEGKALTAENVITWDVIVQIIPGKAGRAADTTIRIV